MPSTQRRGGLRKTHPLRTGEWGGIKLIRPRSRGKADTTTRTAPVGERHHANALPGYRTTNKSIAGTPPSSSLAPGVQPRCVKNAPVAAASSGPRRKTCIPWNIPWDIPWYPMRYSLGSCGSNLIPRDIPWNLMGMKSHGIPRHVRWDVPCHVPWDVPCHVPWENQKMLNTLESVLISPTV